MRVDFPLEQIFGRPPREVEQLFRSQGLDPALPYRSKITFSRITIEQEPPRDQRPARFFIPIPARTY